jgi:hypothetical protein
VENTSLDPSEFAVGPKIRSVGSDDHVDRVVNENIYTVPVSDASSRYFLFINMML